MDTDYRALCAELLDALDGWHQAVFETGTGWVRPDETYLLDRARAALAEPVTAPAGPTDEELLEIARTVDLLMEDGSTGYLDFADVSGLVVAFARAVLARFGNHFPDATKMVGPVEGEMAELIEELRMIRVDVAPCDSDVITRAADLLAQRHPAPVPVAEGLPKPEDCDAKGSCWFFDPCDDGWWWYRSALFIDGDPSPLTHWLPATALPLPTDADQPPT